MVRKSIFILVTLLLGTMSTGCGLETLASANADDIYATNNVENLRSGCAYVWNPAGDESIYDDVRKANAENVFFKLGLGDYNFKGEEVTDTGEYPRTVWMKNIAPPSTAIYNI